MTERSKDGFDGLRVPEHPLDCEGKRASPRGESAVPSSDPSEVALLGSLGRSAIQHCSVLQTRPSTKLCVICVGFLWGCTVFGLRNPIEQILVFDARKSMSHSGMTGSRARSVRGSGGLGLRGSVPCKPC